MSLKILIQPYNNFAQNPAGGVQTRVYNYINAMSRLDCTIEIFDKTKHKVEEWNLIHFFKLTIEHYELIKYAKSKGVKIVISSIVPLRNGLKIKLHRLLGRIIPLHTILDINGKMLELADIVLAQTNEEKDFIKKNYFIRSDKFDVIPNGISPKILNGDASLAYESFGNKPFVLVVGRVDSNKNQLNVIRALKNTDIPLIIVGGPDPADPAYFEQCKKESNDNVKFAGWVPQSSPMMGALYAAAKVVVLPSFHEIFGNAIFEGAATLNNIVYSKTIEISEYDLLSRGARIIEPNDTNNIKNAIVEAYETPVSTELSKYVLKNFTWSAIAQKHLCIFSRMVCNG